MNLKQSLEELKRRNVLKAGLAYIVGSWIVIQVLSIIIPAIEAPDYIMKLVLVLLAIGFPIWVVFAWVYEITPDGLRRTKEVKPEESIRIHTNNRLNHVILGALIIAIGLIIYDVLTESPVNNSSITASKDDKSIAVLAFVDMSPDKDQEYFSDGISEEILNLLAKIKDLRVISRTSAFSFKGSNTMTEEIGKKLNVAHVLEGSVRKSGNTLRITAQLINTEDGAHIWSETYDRELEDVFQIQDEIAQQVTQKLKTTILGEELKSQVVDTEAYNLYLRAKALMISNKSAENETAIKLLEKALTISPDFALGWVNLSVAYSRSVNNFGIRPITYYDSSMVMAQKALALDPNSADAYSVLAYGHLVLGNEDKAIEACKKGLSLSPNNMRTTNVYGLILREKGEIDKALPLFEKVAILDPLQTKVFNYNIATCYENLAMYDQANNYYHKIIDEGDDVITLKQLAEIAAVQGEEEKVNNYLERLLALNNTTLSLNDAGKIWSFTGNVQRANEAFGKALIKEDFDALSHSKTAFYSIRKHQLEGNQEKALLELDELQKAILGRFDENNLHYDNLWDLAIIETLRGNEDEALSYIEKMGDHGGFLKYNVINLDPNLDAIKNNPEYLEFIEEVQSRVEIMKEIVMDSKKLVI